MARVPRVTASEVVRTLLKQGFYLDRQSGPHRVYLNARNRRVTVTHHTGKTLKLKTLKSILRQAGWTVEEFVMLLQK